MTDESSDENLSREEWRDKFRDMLDGIEKKGDYCVGKDITRSISRFSPKICVDGLDGEQLVFPLLDYQAKRLRSVAEKAPFGKGLDTVIDESVRKAWQIDPSKIHFHDSEQWQEALDRIVLDCVSSLGMVSSQRDNVQANLYKMLLYEPGGHFKKHRDTEKERNMFGTLVIQFPSKFKGGSLIIEHAGETKTFDFSERSDEAIFATAFYADCEHELLPVKEGWRLCLAYNLVMCRNTLPLPNASGLTLQLEETRILTKQWMRLFNNVHGYLLEHDYTQTNLHFSSLKGRDKEVVSFLRGSRDRSGNPLFVVCLLLIEKYESGTASSEGYYGYGYGGGYDDGDHTMDEVHESKMDTRHWIGPDDKQISRFGLKFDLDESLLTDDDIDEIFGEDPSRQEYEGYTGNAGPTLDYWYYRSAVVFWPREMNMKVIKSCGLSYMLSYLKVASSVEMSDICNYIIEQLEGRKIAFSKDIFSGLCQTKNEELVVRSLKCCNIMPNIAFGKELVTRMDEFKSQKINSEVMEVLKRTSSTNNETSLSIGFMFLDMLEKRQMIVSLKNARECIVEAVLSKTCAQIFKSNNVGRLAKFAFLSRSSHFNKFVDEVTKVDARQVRLDLILENLMLLGDEAVAHPLVVQLANKRAMQLHSKNQGGIPQFSWRQTGASFPGSQSGEVNSFLRGKKEAQTFYNFNGISHARNWASKYFSSYGQRLGYSATAVPDGRGSGAFVTVTKTKAAHQKMVEMYHEREKELALLRRTFKDSLLVEAVTPMAHNKREIEASANHSPSKKHREVIIIDDK